MNATSDKRQGIHLEVIANEVEETDVAGDASDVAETSENPEFYVARQRDALVVALASFFVDHAANVGEGSEPINSGEVLVTREFDVLDEAHTVERSERLEGHVADELQPAADLSRRAHHIDVQQLGIVADEELVHLTQVLESIDGV